MNGTLLVALAIAFMAHEPRWCGVVRRDADGTIARSRAVVAQFQRLHPCPVTGARTGACRGWAVDHVVPLVCGGCDTMNNLQWLPTAMKSARGALPKDRWEQRVYCPHAAHLLPSLGR